MWFDSRPAAPSAVPLPDQRRELVLYQYQTCPYCQRVFGKLRALNLDIPMRDIHRDDGAQHELLTKTGRTTVPCLFVDGEPLFESADIMAWLEAYAKAIG